MDGKVSRDDAGGTCVWTMTHRGWKTYFCGGAGSEGTGLRAFEACCQPGRRNFARRGSEAAYEDICH